MRKKSCIVSIYMVAVAALSTKISGSVRHMCLVYLHYKGTHDVTTHMRIKGNKWNRQYSKNETIGKAVSKELKTLHTW